MNINFDFWGFVRFILALIGIFFWMRFLLKKMLISNDWKSLQDKYNFKEPELRFSLLPLPFTTFNSSAFQFTLRAMIVKDKLYIKPVLWLQLLGMNAVAIPLKEIKREGNKFFINGLHNSTSVFEVKIGCVKEYNNMDLKA